MLLQDFLRDLTCEGYCNFSLRNLYSIVRTLPLAEHEVKILCKSKDHTPRIGSLVLQSRHACQILTKLFDAAS